MNKSMEQVTEQDMNQVTEQDEKKELIVRQISNESGIEIGCSPGVIRPDSILRTILEQIDELSEHDFIVKSKSFGDWNFSIYSDKKDILDKNYDKIFDILQKLYNQRTIRYAAIHI
jgi:hypothetical protein